MKLIKINKDHYIVVDDSEIKKGDYLFDKGFGISKARWNTYEPEPKTQWRITHSTQPLESIVTENSFKSYEFMPLQEVKELIGEVDVEKKAELLYPKTINPDSILKLGGYREAYTEGYNQALEDNKEKKYTEEDLQKAFTHCAKYSAKCIVSKIDVDFLNELEMYLESIQPKTEWEVEIVDDKLKLK